MYMQTVIYIFYVAKNNYVVISEIVFIFVVFATHSDKTGLPDFRPV